MTMTARSRFHEISFALVCYVIVALALFGNPVKPILLAIGMFILAPISICVAVLAGIVLGIITFKILFEKVLKPKGLARIGLGIFVLWMFLFTVVTTALITSALRVNAIARLSPDKVITRSFIGSLHATPDIFSLHGAAIKNCVPYAWSYRDMDFYELRNDTAINVIPQEWLDACNIRRE